MVGAAVFPTGEGRGSPRTRGMVEKEEAGHRTVVWEKGNPLHVPHRGLTALQELCLNVPFCTEKRCSLLPAADVWLCGTA